MIVCIANNVIRRVRSLYILLNENGILFLVSQEIDTLFTASVSNKMHMVGKYANVRDFNWFVYILNSHTNACYLNLQKIKCEHVFNSFLDDDKHFFFSQRLHFLINMLPLFLRLLYYIWMSLPSLFHPKF